MSRAVLDLEFAAVTTQGLRRATNEDAMAVAGALITGEATEPVNGVLPLGRSAAFIVSDGVGGHAHGARASREVAAGFLDLPQEPPVSRTCAEAVLRANLRLNEVMLQEPHTSGMAATVAGLVVDERRVCWFNVGDSRVYRKSPVGLVQLSVDDTRPMPGRRSHALLRSLGGQRQIVPVFPHVGEGPGCDDDRYLICSDGVWGMLPDSVIDGILDLQDDASHAVASLLSASLSAGGSDNISAILVQTRRLS